MTALPSVKFKDGQTASEFDQIKPELRAILNDMGRYCDLAGNRFVITDLLSSVADDARLGRVSTSHLEGRACDVSVIGWSEKFIKQFIEFFTDKYGHLGAVSKSDGKQKLIVDHVGTARHLHIQIRP